MSFVNTTPGRELLKAVRASLVLKDQSISSWAKKNNVARQNLTKALLGEWSGPKATALVDKITSELNGGSK